MSSLVADSDEDSGEGEGTPANPPFQQTQSPQGDCVESRRRLGGTAHKISATHTAATRDTRLLALPRIGVDLDPDMVDSGCVCPAASGVERASTRLGGGVCVDKFPSGAVP